MKVFLHTKKSKNTEEVNQYAEFERIPVVGEYISLPSNDEYWYKVVLVRHIPLTHERKESPPNHNVEIYAMGENPFQAQKEAKYFPKSQGLPFTSVQMP